MSNIPIIGAINSRNRDPYINNVVLFLKGDNQNLIDSSAIPKSLTIYGDAQYSTLSKKYGAGSISFNRSTSTYITVAPSSDFLFLGDYTMETWINWDGVFTNTGTFICGTGGVAQYDQFGIFRIDGNSLMLGYGVSVFTGIVNSTPNSWNHLATCREGNTVRGYLNGNLITTNTYSTPLGSDTLPFYIGKRRDNDHPLGGYLDSLRITKGVARYNQNFNVETETFLNL